MRAELDRLAGLGYDGVILTGGEPTCSPLLIDAIEHSAGLGLRCRMITNGQLLADRELFGRCVGAGLTHLPVSIHSHRPSVHDFLTRNEGSFDAVSRCLALVPELGVTCDVNTVINAYNADHLLETAAWICGRFPFVRHYVWNNMDPDGPMASANPDCVPRHRDFQVSLEWAMEHLRRTGRTFRAERVPLCFMTRFPWASTETRKIIKGEERSTLFLDEKGLVRQREFLHGKGAACDECRWDPICAGMYSMGRAYDERELSPVFLDPRPVIEAILGPAASEAAVSGILSRKGRRPGA
jgi:MoaA/NifB/PqqE/SkfB family radical SAM enzyme